MRRSAALLSAAALLVGLPAPAPARLAATPVQTEWHRYHRDLAHSGYSPTTPPVGRLSKAWSATLDAPVYASPLVARGVVVVATERNSLFGFSRQGRLLWRHRDLPPVRSAQLPCGNVDPLGITGTPVYDPGSKRVYAVVTTVYGGRVRHFLTGVDPLNGKVTYRRSVDPRGQDPTVENQRGALTVTRGRVLVTYGGHYGDCGDFHGYVVSVPLGAGRVTTYRTGTRGEAGMWQPSGPTVGPDTSVYVVTGNGRATSGAWDGGNAVHRISPVQASRRYSFFAPADWALGNRLDADLGSSGATLIGNRIWIQGKTATGYLLDKMNLGGVGHPLATVRGACAQQFGGTAVHGASAYLPCTDGVRKITVSGNRVAFGWKAGRKVVGSPVVGGGVVWTLDPGAGVLYALAESNGAVRQAFRVGPTSRFATPALSGGLVLVGTLRGIYAVKGA
jgi:hypothetical protein